MAGNLGGWEGALTDEDVKRVVQRDWQRTPGAIATGRVVSHISAMTKGVGRKLHYDLASDLLP